LRPVPLEEFLMLVGSDNPFPRGTCLVTFDDGWYDNHAFALPILSQHGVPAVVFVATNYVGTDQCFWQEELARLLYLALTHEDSAAAVFARAHADRVPSTQNAEARRAIREIVTKLKAKPAAETLDIVQSVRREFGLRFASGLSPSSGEDRFMTWQQVKDLEASGLVTIGSHGMTHVPMTKQDAASAAHELAHSRSVIQERIGGDCAAFAYPNGDFDDDVVTHVRAAGYSLAFTTLRGHVAAGGDPLRLNRMNMHEAATRTPARFLSRIADVF
jgi:peptidoglycan/xylan/chitin deacetylase (PgdA/CDA1 family)